MEPWLIWVLAGLALLGAELVLPGAFLLWAGLAAIGAGLVALALAPGFPALVVIFVALVAAGITLALRRRRHAAHTDVNAPGSGLVGRTGTVLPHAGPGLRVRIGDSDWSAQSATSSAPSLPAPGSTVRVTAVEGTILLVQTEVGDVAGA
ncbi:NfeD family protein [Roseomonas sp. WA12]